MEAKFHRHSCPRCGYRVSWTRLHLRAWIWAEWSCECCGSHFSFARASRWLCAGLGGLWCFFLFFFVLSQVQWWVWLILLYLGATTASRLDRIRLAQEPHEGESVKMYEQPKEA